MTAERILWYYADPMCSWCFGFAPVITAIRDAYRDRVRIALMMGGLRPGTVEPVTPKFRAEVLHHWRQVHEHTGQAFAFEGAMPEGFVYDTEPPSRAVVAVHELDPAATFDYFKSVQSAFYMQGRDITKAETLASLAEQHGIIPERFLDRFHADDTRQRVHRSFAQTREAGVRGFPTIILERSGERVVLTPGFRQFDVLKPQLDAWLAESGGAS